MCEILKCSEMKCEKWQRAHFVENPFSRLKNHWENEKSNIQFPNAEHHHRWIARRVMLCRPNAIDLKLWKGWKSIRNILLMWKGNYFHEADERRINKKAERFSIKHFQFCVECEENYCRWEITFLMTTMLTIMMMIMFTPAEQNSLESFQGLAICCHCWMVMRWPFFDYCWEW